LYVNIYLTCFIVCALLQSVEGIILYGLNHGIIDYVLTHIIVVIIDSNI